MKKSIIYTATLAAAALVGTAGLVAINNVNAETIDAPLEPASSLIADLASSQDLTTKKDETVYVIANANGETNKTFVGNTIYNGSETLPFEFSIKYYLDGTEIDAKDLANKSGHVKIVFSYDAANYYQGKQIPFLALTGLTLDAGKFANVKIDHGKILESGDNLTLVGYAFPGVNYDFSTDLLWGSFTVEADTTNFELPVTYSLLTNEIFSEFDTSKLNDLDSLANSMNDLSGGLDQIITGANSLEDGLKTLAEKSQALVSGVNQLSAGLTELTKNNDTLTSGAETVFNSLLARTSAKISVELTVENYADTLAYIIANTPSPEAKAALEATLTSLDSYNEFYTGLLAYTTGVSQAATGATELTKNLPALISGESELVAGSEQLSQGLTTFKQDGIDKLVNFANQDLEKFTRNARATVNAATSYRHFSNQNATSVKFIIKTASIK